jgi:Uma2 family endonuclease
MPRLLQPITVEEFLLRVPDGQKADLLDGVIYVASPDSPESADVNVFLSGLLNSFVRKQKLVKIYGPRSAFRLSDRRAPEPDIAFVRAERLHLWKGSIFQGPPDLAVEVVSPDSVERDTVHKRAAYERSGVEEYWVVHLVEGRCIFLILTEKGYIEAPLEPGNVFRSRVLPGFWLETDWVLSNELPPPDECLEKIYQASK